MRSVAQQCLRLGRLDHPLQVEAMLYVQLRRLILLDRLGEVGVHGPVRVRPGRGGAVDCGRTAGTEDLDFGGGDGRRGGCGHRRLAESADLMVEHQAEPPAAFAVRLHADDRAERRLQQIDEVDSLVAEDAALDTSGGGPADHVSAGDDRPLPPFGLTRLTSSLRNRRTPGLYRQVSPICESQCGTGHDAVPPVTATMISRSCRGTCSTPRCTPMNRRTYPAASIGGVRRVLDGNAD